MLSPFDHAVIDYARSRGETTESIYKRIDMIFPNTYRERQTESQLFAKLEMLKSFEFIGYQGEEDIVTTG